MADITMCTGEGCPLRDGCYRYTAEADGEAQTYFGKVPYGDGGCRYYWEI